MLHIQSFSFNPFQENTYLLWNSFKECIVIDPGCSNEKENKELISFIRNQGLMPKYLINTHCHLDHVLGNHLIEQEFNLLPIYHELEEANLSMAEIASNMYGVPYIKSNKAVSYLKPGVFKFGDESFSVLFTPGHSAGSICLYSSASGFIIAGDVLFEGSIGRTDLPGGNHEQLLKSIQEELYVLPNDTIVYPGHGDPTTIGKEKKTNPFVRS